MKLSRIAAALGAAFFISGPAFGQGAVLQSGTVVPGNLPMWLSNGVIADSGNTALSITSPASGQAVVWTGTHGIGGAGTATSPASIPITSMGLVGTGQNFCLYDAVTTGANHSLCFGTVGNNATITSVANNSATAGNFNFVVNGATVTLPSTSGTLLNGITAGGGISVTGSAPSPTVSLSVGANNTVMANISGSSAAPTANTLPAVFDSAFGSTQGDILWRSSGGWAALGPGANGTCLTYSTGGGGAVTWGSCAGTGGTGTVTSVATGTGLTGGTITTTGTISFAAVANNTVLANISGGSAAPSANTVSGVFDSALGSTRGSIIERGASGWTVIAPGTSGYIFASNGSGADPAWQSVSATLDNALGNTRGAILERGASGWTILAPGTSGYALVSNGSGADPSYQNVTAGLTQPTQTVLSAAGSGTYTTPVGATGLHIRMVGGGGGGGGGGSGASAGGGGGSTTFSTYTASGGGGGSITCTPGVGTGGKVNLSGGYGGGTESSAPGGASAFGGGGQTNNSGGGSAGLAPGSGGGAAHVGTSMGSGCAGGYVEVWINSPSGTYSYTVGVGGTAGSGSSSGGAGAPGIIIIEERYY
jgi:hypothetical protein